jgi:hypothetical protein
VDEFETDVPHLLATAHPEVIIDNLVPDDLITSGNLPVELELESIVVFEDVRKDDVIDDIVVEFELIDGVVEIEDKV